MLTTMHTTFYNQYSALDWCGIPNAEYVWEDSNANKVNRKNRFSETCIRNKIPIGILVTLKNLRIEKYTNLFESEFCFHILLL